MPLPKIIADFETQLATAISIGATSFTIASAVDDDGVSLPSGLYYFTIDNGLSSKEYLSGTLSGTSVTDVVSVSRQGAETSGAVRVHRVGASVIITDFNTFKKYMDELALAGAPDASTSSKGVVEIAISSEIDSNSATGTTGAPLAITPDQLILSKYGTALTSVTSLTGVISPYGGRTAPTGWLLCDGSEVSRSTYAALFAVLAPSGTFTVTIASPGVFSKTGHGLVAGDRLHFTTTGALPTGLSTNTDYYVIATGLTTDAFQVALTPTGSGVVTSGSQSGVHTLYASAFGKGNGSTTFNLPDMRARMPVGISSADASQSLSFEPSAVDFTTNDTITVPNAFWPLQGQKVQFTTTGTLPAGLSLATDYWIIRTSDTTVQIATSIANANAGAGSNVNMTNAGTGVHTMTVAVSTKAQKVINFKGGEETHGLATTELPGHTHTIDTKANSPGTNSVSGAATGGSVVQFNSGSTGGNAAHNNMQPFIGLNFIIKT